jgi:hypothetical protein
VVFLTIIFCMLNRISCTWRSQYWYTSIVHFISRILIDNLVLINLICLVRPILTYNSEISFMDYFLVYHRAKQRAILRNGNMDHLTFIDRTPFEKVHLIFCKHLLGTKKTSSNIGVKAELGRFPVENLLIRKQFYILPVYILTI